MDPALAPGTTPRAIVFQDGLGERRRISDVSGADTIEQLCLRSELTAIPSFEFALRERAGRLASFRHVYFGRVRSVDRLNDPASSLVIVSDSIKGVRLANLLAASERRPMTLDISASIHLIRQLVAAVAMLHENAGDIAHGAIGPERIIVTPNARVVLVEHVLGSALEQLHYSRERYWKDLRIALPPSLGLPSFDHRADVTQIGAVALSLILGRLLHEDEYPSKVGDALASAWAITSKGELEPLPPGLRTWIARALQLDSRHAFTTATDARDELERVLAGEADDDGFVAGPASRSESAPAPAADRHVMDDERLRERLMPAAAPATSMFHAEPVEAAPSAAAPRLAPSTPAPSTPATSPGFSSTFAPPSSTPADRAPGHASELSVFQKEPAKNETTFTTFEPTARADAPAFTHSSDTSYATAWASTGVEDAHTEDEAPHGNVLAGLIAFTRQPMGKIAAAAIALVIVSAGGVFAGRRYLTGSAATLATGTLSINSDPPGAQVVVDGRTGGVTPLTLTLPQGPHNVELHGGGGDPRTLPITIVAGKEVSQFVELPKVTAFGQLQVRTEPAGAQVTVDGIPRGKSPVLVESLAAGEHAVALEGAGGGAGVKQTVTVEAGMTASLVVPMTVAEAAPASGWIAIKAPVEVQIFEGKRLVGTNQSDRLMMSAGRHDVEIVNDTLGFHETKSVQVPAGKLAPIKLDWPKGTVAVNALPWADVWVDGDHVGETPIGNLSLPIGPHEFVFRHPDLGEQRYATTVSLKAPSRVSVDLRKR